MAKSNLEKLVEKALALGITEEALADATTIEQVQALIDEKSPADNEPKPEAKTKKKLYFYWVKVKSFINENKTIEAGLYSSEEKQERLDRSKKEYVECFEGKIPEITLHKIAESYRVTIFGKGNGDVRPYDEILSELIKEIN